MISHIVIEVALSYKGAPKCQIIHETIISEIHSKLDGIEVDPFIVDFEVINDCYTGEAEIIYLSEAELSSMKSIMRVHYV
jgi:hypothetical protein